MSEIKEPTQAICRNCQKPLIWNGTVNQWVHKETYSPNCIIYSRESKFADPMVVPDGVVFTFEERETINLKKIKNAQKYQYITVCNLCNRPVHNREDARWRCLICGNRFKDKRTTFKIQKGLIYTWTEQRQETE